MQSPAHARRLGIGMVFQHFSLFESLTVAENVALGMNDAKDRANLRERIVEISQKYGLPLSPDQTVHDLSVGERQRIEIVRCLLQNPRLLIMDEPTSVLTPQEVEKLFETLRRLAAEGCSILYISHKLEEIRALCDTATIMRLGRVVAHCVPSEKSAKELAELMINAQLDPPSRSRRVLARRRERRGSRSTISRMKSPHPFGTDLKQVSFAVSPGEILGVAGIAGNGQTELMDALSGEVLADAPETITLDGVAVGRMGPRERRDLGGCFVPEERNGHGAVGAMTLERKRLSHRRSAPLADAVRLRRSGADRRFRQGDHPPFRRPHHRPEGAGARAVGRQSAEVPGRTRSDAVAGRRWSSTSRPGASTPARRRRSIARWPSWRKTARRW